MSNKASAQSESVQEEASQLAQKLKVLQLTDLRMLSGGCAVNFKTVHNEAPALTQHMRINGCVHDNTQVIVQIQFSIFSPDDEINPTLRIDACFGLTYAGEWHEPPSEKEASTIAKLVGVNNAWPYWREFVQSMTGRMGLPPLSLPLVQASSLQFPQSRSNEPKPKAPAKKRPRGSKHR